MTTPLRPRRHAPCIASGGRAAWGWIPLLLVACAPQPDEPQPPNVVLIIIDTLRADKLSSYGCELDTTPGLTQLAEQGVQFDSVIAQSSWTLPSVGSLLTSRYPRSLGLYTEESQIVPDEAETLAEIFRANRYLTFGITANPNLNSRYNFHQGFDQYADSLVVFHGPDSILVGEEVSYRNAPLRTSPDVFAATLAYVRDAGPIGPFYVQLNLMEVHEHGKDVYLREEYRSRFEGEDDAPYLRAVAQVASDTAEFIRTLGAMPGWQDTLFVVTSDHGEGLGDHPDVERSEGHGHLLYESSTRVPWILFNPRWGGDDPGDQKPLVQRVAQSIRLLDLVPTLLDYLDLPIPTGCQGRSAWPLAQGAAQEAGMPEYFVLETYFRGVNKISALDTQWQYLSNHERGGGLPKHELQALNRKPDGLLTDKSRGNREQVQLMRAFLGEWETRHEKAEAVAVLGDLDREARAQLKSIGYLGGDEDKDQVPDPDPDQD